MGCSAADGAQKLGGAGSWAPGSLRGHEKSGWESPKLRKFFRPGAGCKPPGQTPCPPQEQLRLNRTGKKLRDHPIRPSTLWTRKQRWGRRERPGAHERLEPACLPACLSACLLLSFLKVPATRQEGPPEHPVGPAGLPAGPLGLCVVLGHESEKFHCDTNPVNYDFWGQAVAHD